jgi:hypothetical protein
MILPDGSIRITILEKSVKSFQGFADSPKCSVVIVPVLGIIEDNEHIDIVWWPNNRPPPVRTSQERRVNPVVLPTNLDSQGLVF